MCCVSVVMNVIITEKMNTKKKKCVTLSDELLSRNHCTRLLLLVLTREFATLEGLMLTLNNGKFPAIFEMKSVICDSEK